MHFRKRERREGFPRPCLVFPPLAALSALIYAVAAMSPAFAEWFNGSVGAFVRAALAFLTSPLPISLAEILLFSSPLIVVGVTVLGVRRYCGTWRETWRFLLCIVSVFSLFFTVFVFSFGTGYQTRSLEERMGLSVGNVTKEELAFVAARLAGELNALCDSVTFGGDGFSVMPTDYNGMNGELLSAFETVSLSYPFVQRMQSRIKPVLASRLMSYTHITGVYSYFTGEANLNVYFPDYTLPFTAAHELAHQRGIARENEANFVAFLVCESADDPYVRYSGYLNLFEYVANALYRTDREAYGKVLSTLDARLVGELRAYAAFFKEFEDSAAADISGTVNDAYLKLNGNEAGVASYGLVVELAVAYFSP